MRSGPQDSVAVGASSRGRGWSGSRAVPAFFDPELEAFAQIVAAVWIGLSVLVAALLLLPGRGRR